MNSNDAIRALVKGHESGRWEVEDIDIPPPSRAIAEKSIRHPKSVLPADFQLPPHRNLLREFLNL